jgi:hypothetical protein
MPHDKTAKLADAAKRVDKKELHAFIKRQPRETSKRLHKVLHELGVLDKDEP